MNTTDKKGEIVIYVSDDGSSHLEVKLENETLWLTQKAMAELFEVGVPAISKHLKNIFEEGELEESMVISKMETTTLHGAIDGKTQTRETAFYNLDAIISVGYRINSSRATQFRKWASQILKEYIVKGFALDDKRLKNIGGGDYWHELLERIRDIRSSEKVMYRQVLDLYATSADYNPTSAESIAFFKMVQNKFHFAAHGNTAAEVIYNRVDSEKPFMGLKSFSGELPVRADVVIAKNYLNENELKILNNLVSAYFDIAEVAALEHRLMYMHDYVQQLDQVISAAGKCVLNNSGKVTHKQAVDKALEEYRKYQVNTLSPVEKAYLETIKQIESKSSNAARKSRVKKKS